MTFPPSATSPAPVCPAPVYLDYNASAPLRPEARAAMLEAWEKAGNPASIHAFGRAARGMVEEARAVVAHAANCTEEEVLFTSGGTEGNATALRVASGVGGGSALPTFISATSHSSALKHVPEGAAILPVLPSGLLDMAAVEVALHTTSAPFLVSVEWVNNETGVIQPVQALHTLVKQRGGFLHLDGVQALGKVPLDVAPDLLTLSAHKTGGPQGVGALIVRNRVPFTPLLKGGGQERGRRAGTLPVATVAGFAAALKATTPLDPGWREDMEARLLSVPGAEIFGADGPRVANTTCLAHPALSAELFLMKLDLAGFAVSGGAACSSGTPQPSHVLTAMGASASMQRAAIRISFGWKSTLSELASFAQRWTEIVRSAIK